MSTETVRNEAAERLWRLLGQTEHGPLIRDALRDERRIAKTEERRATVERIRTQLRPEFFDSISGETVANVLDEEAQR